MGLFDFFKKNVQPQDERTDTVKKFTKKEVDEFNVGGKSLNEIYAEKRAQNNGVLPSNEEPEEQLMTEKMLSDFEQALSSGAITAEFTPNPAHQPGNVDETQIDRYIAYGAFQLQHKNYDNALTLFNKAIELGDKTGLAYANLGSLHQELGHYQQSLENYDKAIELNSGDARLYHNKALVLEESGDKVGAGKNYEKALQIDDRHVDALNNLGVLKVLDGNYVEALKCFNKVLDIDPADKDALTNKISSLVQLDLHEALQFYVSIHKGTDLSEIEAIITQGLLARHAEVDAVAVLQELYKTSKEARYIKLQSFILYGNDKSAAYEAINLYLSLDPSDQVAVDLKIDLAFNLMETIGEAAFIEAVDECLALDDKNPTALHYKIQILLKQQKLEEALDRVEALFIPYYPQQNVLNVFTQVYNHLDKDQAMPRFERFAKQLDDNGRYQLEYMKGLYLKGKRDYDEAITVFSSLNDLRKFSWNYYQIAIMENLNGNTERCLLNLKKTFELEPGLKEDARHYVELQNLASNVSFLSLLR